MKFPPTNCHRCNSVQNFPRKERQISGAVQIYILCLTCRRETILATFTKDELRERNKNIRRRNQRIRRGVR